MKVPDYVLQRFSKEERPEVDDAIKKSAAACETWLSKPYVEVMNQFNGA